MHSFHEPGILTRPEVAVAKAEPKAWGRSRGRGQLSRGQSQLSRGWGQNCINFL